MKILYFISDLHLCESRPEIIVAFTDWLLHQALDAHAIYILGDFFEYWAGDDAINETFHRPIIEAIQSAIHRGTQIYLMHGNRDFLMGHDFEKVAGVQLLDDPTIINVGSNRVLLSHGDALCTDDIEYMNFRAMVREPGWQADFLAKPLQERLAYIQYARDKSEQDKSVKHMDVMDIHPSAFAELVKTHGYPAHVVHGHTHRPAWHKTVIDGHPCVRYVLGDWYSQGSALKLSYEEGESSLRFDSISIRSPQ